VRQANICMCLQKMRGHRLFLVFAVLPALLALTSCGGGSSSSTTTTTPTITVSCVPTQVSVNGKSVCTPTPSGLTSTLVTWEAGGVAGGNSTFGTIDANGNYVAPQNVPTNNVVTITAVSQSQNSVTGTASITILASTKISSVVCLDPNSQASLTAPSGSSLACTAESSSGSPISVFWQVNGITNPSATLGIGTMTPQGNYVAPLIPPAGGTVTITAVSQADSTQMMAVVVTVTFGNKVLQGSYAFSTSGRIVSTNAFFARAGSVTAGGDGTLVGGLEDSNEAGSIRQQLIFTGTYSIGPDGRGTMQFCEGINTACTAPTAFFRIAIVSTQQAQIIEFSQPNSTTALMATSGQMDLIPDASVFKTSGLIGTYSFNFAGVSSTAAPQSEIGEFTANGNGTIDADGVTNGVSTPGRIDINGGGVQTLSASTYVVQANGRGTASIATTGGPFAFSFYLISASRARFIEIDSKAILVGDAFKQEASPCSWGNNALNGAIVFETSGTGTNGGIGDLVSFTASSGGFTAGSGSIDENSGGTVPPPASGLNGNYAIDTCGRGTLGVASHSYVFYPISTNSAVIQETTAGVVARGLLVQPQGGPFTNASFQGSYAASLSGTNPAGVTGKEEDLVGQLTSDGTSKVTAGSFDINNFGATQAGQATLGTYTSVAANGRATALLSPTLNFVLYVVSPTQLFALDTDSTDVAIGSLFKQF
jgi:hypothetical protein